jgi:glucans biosynthesis protein
MFLRGPADPHMKSDARAEVHDSDGLSILTTYGDHIWRPLANPAAVQMSAFVVTPAGFGLEQRRREPAAYSDSEAKYEHRPSIWIEPQGDWGAGEVRLLEIPTANEYADNVAAFWRPAEAWRAGSVQRLTYRLHWTDAPQAMPVARVVSTEILPVRRKQSACSASISTSAASPALPKKICKPDVWSTAGALSNIHRDA